MVGDDAVPARDSGAFSQRDSVAGWRRSARSALRRTLPASSRKGSLTISTVRGTL